MCKCSTILTDTKIYSCKIGQRCCNTNINCRKSDGMYTFKNLLAPQRLFIKAIFCTNSSACLR